MKQSEFCRTKRSTGSAALTVALLIAIGCLGTVSCKGGDAHGTDTEVLGDLGQVDSNSHDGKGTVTCDQDGFSTWEEVLAFVEGKPCDPADHCGSMEYCDCSDWAECVGGVWVRKGLCDDSCLEDAIVDQSGEDGPVPCPAGRGDLEQSEAEEMNGKLCDGAVVQCGSFEPCDCTAWCDCFHGVWECDWVCDDSCLEREPDLIDTVELIDTAELIDTVDTLPAD